MTQPRVSVVMVTYHTGAVLQQAIASVLAQTIPVELILVNNGNPVEVVDALRAQAEAEPRLTVISGQGNVGFARACNIGAAQAKGDYILLMNPDCYIEPDGLEVLLNEFEGFFGSMLAGGALQHPDGSLQRGGKRALLTPRNALVESLYLHKILPSVFGKAKLNFHETASSVTEKVPAISGAFMAMRRTDYQRLGGMDEGYFLHVEDMDLCMRVTQAGGAVIYVPSVKVFHHLSTSDVPSPIVEWHKTKGFWRYFWTHFRHSSDAWMLPLISLLALARFGVRSLLSLVRR